MASKDSKAAGLTSILDRGQFFYMSRSDMSRSADAEVRANAGHSIIAGDSSQ